MVCFGRVLGSLLLMSSLACGGAGDKKAEAPDGEDVASDGGDGGEAKGGDTSPAKKASSSGIPDACSEQVDDVCLPPKKFVRKLCVGDYPTVALAMFKQGTPWTRGYLTQKTKAWNASGGGSSPEMMQRDEEVLVLRKFSGQSPGGIEVSGASGGVDALRWDGMCVTLDAAEIRYEAPPKSHNARIIWSRIEYDVREQLKEIDEVYQMYLPFKRACKGVTVGKVSKDCERLDGELSKGLAQWIRDNDSFPMPKKLPK
jgi:hypothetical protein